MKVGAQELRHEVTIIRQSGIQTHPGHGTDRGNLHVLERGDEDIAQADNLFVVSDRPPFARRLHD